MNKTALTILIVTVVVLGGYFLLKGPEATAPTPEANTPNAETSSEPIPSSEPVAPSGSVSPTSSMPVPGNEDVDEMAVAHTVTYTDAGYSPNELRIEKGDTVTFENKSSVNMWTASAMHPTHMVYGGASLEAHCPDPLGTAFDACEGTPPGGSWSFTFTKAGNWGYHDHLHPTLFGKVIVE